MKYCGDNGRKKEPCYYAKCYLFVLCLKHKTTQMESPSSILSPVQRRNKTIDFMRYGGNPEPQNVYGGKSAL